MESKNVDLGIRMDINYISPVNSLGYGVAGWNILKKLGVMANVCYFPIGSPEVDSKADAESVAHYIDNQKFFNPDAVSLRLWHQHDMAMHVGRGKRVGFPIFELDKFSTQEMHHLSQLDSIIVCSEWAKSIILNHIPDMDVSVAPLGVDSNVFSVQESNQSDTVFINIGKWEKRKGHDIIAKIFNKAFTKKDNVQLWMMNSNPFLSDEQTHNWQRFYRGSKLGDKVKIIPRVETHEELSRIMGDSHCGLFPSRAEGWNLELLEMMSCGKYVISTNYSAHTEFCNQDNCHLVDIQKTEKALDGIWFNGQGNWAKIEDRHIDEMVDIMRTVHDKVQSGQTYNEEGRLTAENFSWTNSAQKVMEGL